MIELYRVYKMINNLLNLQEAADVLNVAQNLYIQTFFLFLKVKRYKYDYEYTKKKKR